KVKHPYQAGAITGYFFSIPAGEENYKVTGNAWAAKDFTMLAITPHMHLLGKSISLTMTPPDGLEQKLMAVNHWDYNWQEMYFLKEPIQVKAGTKFHVEATFDNSDK